MNNLAILGASGHGKVIADSAESAGWKKIVFYDDAWPKDKTNGIWPVMGNTKDLIKNLSDYDGVVIAIGNNQERILKQTELLNHGATMVSIIHPSAQISKYVEVGVGVIVMAGAVINVDTKLGECCIVNTGATIDHDCNLGNGVHISPGAHIAGGVTIGEGSWVGIGVNIKQLITIGSNTTIGAGSVVINNVEESTTVVGVPAKPLNTHS